MKKPPLPFALIVLLTTLIWVWFAEAQAAASFTFEIKPARPVIGRDVEYYLYTWLPKPDGAPDLSAPANMSGYPFDVRAYPYQVKSSAPEEAGIPINLKQLDSYTWRGEIVFPGAGQWSIVVRNSFPPLAPAQKNREYAVLDVQVVDRTRILDRVSWIVFVPIVFAILSLVLFFRRLGRLANSSNKQ